MTGLLLRLFVKDYQNCDDPNVHTALGRLAGITGILCNTLLFLGKLAAGFLSGSIALIADAVNNLTDAASSVVTLLGFHLARRPADKDHPYGHARYEYLSGLVIAALILVFGLELGKSSLKKIFVPEPVTVTILTIAIPLVSIGVKLWMCFFFKNLGIRIRSATLQAASLDSRNDVLATGAVVLGLAAYRLWGINADGYTGLAVAVFILFSGIRITKETVSPLLGTRADKNLVAKLSALVSSHEKILGIHDLLVHDYGPGQCFASVHAEISAELNPMECHDIIDAIERSAAEQLNVHLVIHSDPVLTGDPHWEAMGQLTESTVKAIDPRLSIHDFRITGGENAALEFDLAIPYDLETPEEVLRQEIEERLKKCGCEYPAIIRFDRKP